VKEVLILIVIPNTVLKDLQQQMIKKHILYIQSIYKMRIKKIVFIQVIIIMKVSTVAIMIDMPIDMVVVITYIR